jgi:hypothetical protein
MFKSIIFCSKLQKLNADKICENKKEFYHIEHTRSKKKATTSFIFFKSVNDIKIRGKKENEKKNQVDARRGKMMVQSRKNQQKEGGRKRGKTKGKRGRNKKKNITNKIE